MIPGDKNAKLIDARIRKELLVAASRLRENKIYRANIRRWLIASGVIFLVLVARTFWSGLSGITFPIVCAVILLTLFANLVGKLKIPLDFAGTAKAVEKKFPDLGNLLTTALEQKRSGEGLNFLQEKVISNALQFSFYQYWEDTGKRVQRKLRIWHSGAIIMALGLVALTWYSKTRDVWISSPTMPVLISSIEITPGDTEVERGSALVVAARFRGDFPRSATLVLQQDNGSVMRYPMAQSLSDPIFAYTLSGVEESGSYLVEYGGKETESYRMEVFELPDLEQADAFLDYP
ncbi:MAG: hypothetical protein KJT03_10930, partial [Verrucomicrobiae bacterium]|nr:hypothetical protein [Verrucomicrobiae bacterium]